MKTGAMTKTALASYLATKLEVPKKTAAGFLDTLADTAVRETKKTESSSFRESDAW